MRWSRVVVGLVGLAVVTPFAPLPRSCAPQGEELDLARYAELAQLGQRLTRPELEAALVIVDPHGLLKPYIDIDADAVRVKLRHTDREPWVVVPLRRVALAKAVTRLTRVALDPGHWGGTWSELERRHTVRQVGPAVREGDLSFATARLIERDLLLRGLQVKLLRDPPPSVPFTPQLIPELDLTHETRLWLAETRRGAMPWVAPYWAWALQREGEQFARDNPFELFNRFDLRRRAALAQHFGAQVTLSVHFNLTEANQNGILVFVPGNFMPHELATASQRYWALRLALEGSLPETIRLARTMAAAMMDAFDLPALRVEDLPEPFPNKLAVDAALGVYARNLAILRRSSGVALLLEGPCMNQTQEYARLIKTELDVDGIKAPLRTRAYADAVLAGLRRHEAP